MPQGTYFLVNDTRYDNHHGGLRVVGNLHAAMARRGWTCVGSLPSSSTVRGLRRRRHELAAARMILINGEGSLHHDSRDALRLLEIAKVLLQTHPVVLLNALFQQNDPAQWAPALKRFAAVYARDARSQSELHQLGVDAGNVPDLTFYEYQQQPTGERTRLLCTDSVSRDWTRGALRRCERDPEMDFQTLLTGQLRFKRGPRDWPRAVKYRLYPRLARLGLPIPASHRALLYAQPDSDQFLKRFSASRAVCAARYHAVCFALQQAIPFIAVASNSYKSEALIEEVGLSLQSYLLPPLAFEQIKERLARVSAGYRADEQKIRQFNRRARERIDAMFDAIAFIGCASSRVIAAGGRGSSR